MSKSRAVTVGVTIGAILMTPVGALAHQAPGAPPKGKMSPPAATNTRLHLRIKHHPLSPPRRIGASAADAPLFNHSTLQCVNN
jgi:hypothetical protein